MEGKLKTASVVKDVATQIIIKVVSVSASLTPSYHSFPSFPKLTHL